MSDPKSQASSKDKKAKTVKFKGTKRCALLFFELIALCLGAGLLALFIAIWFLSRGPVSADFLIPHLEKALNNTQAQMEVDIDALQLEWQGWSDRLVLKALDVSLANKFGNFLTINQALIDVSFAQLITGNGYLNRAKIMGVSARIDRYKDGTFHLFNEAPDTYGPPARTTALTIDKIIQNLPPFTEISVSDSEVVYFDQRTNERHLFSRVSLGIFQEGSARKLSDGQQGDVTTPTANNVSGFLTFSLNENDETDVIALDFIYESDPKEMLLTARLGQADIPRMMDFAGFSEIFDIADTAQKEGDIAFDFPLQARGNLRVSNEWQLISMELSAEAQAGKLIWDELPQKEIELNNLQINIDYDPIDRRISLNNTNMSIDDIMLSVQADMSLSQDQGRTRLEGDFGANFDVLDVDLLDRLVPMRFDDKPLYKWLVEKLSKGRFENFQLKGIAEAGQMRASDMEEGQPDVSQEMEKLQASMSGNASRFYKASDEVIIPIPVSKPDWTMLLQETVEIENFISLMELQSTLADRELVWDFDVSDIGATFDFQGLHIDYRPPMMPASNANGRGELQGKSLTLDVERANIGEMEVVSGNLYFDDLVTKGKGTADINLKIETKAIDAFEFLAREPIDFGKHLRFDRKNVKGDAALDVQINFPTVKGLKVEDIDIKVDGTLTETVLPGVLKGMSLSGGPFTLTASQNDYRMTGKGALDGRDIDLNWHSYFSRGKGRPYEGRIIAKMSIDDAFMSRLGVDITDYISGRLAVDIDMSEGWNGRSVLNVKARMRDAFLKIPVFDYVSRSINVGTLSTKVTLMNDKLQRIEDLNITTPDITLQSGKLIFARQGVDGMRLDDGDIQRLKFEQNDFAIRLQETEAGLMKVEIDGERFDARSFLSSSDEVDASGASSDQDDPFEVGLNVASMTTHENQSIANVRAYIMGAEGKLTQLEVDAAIGSGALYVRYKPNMEDRYSLRIEADDAGATFKAFGLTDKVTGGKLTVAGIPTLQGYYGDVRGLFRLDDFNVRAAPALASIVKLMDLPTVMTSLNSQGLDFQRLETEFEWLNRKGGGVINVKDGRTSGGSLGLTFEGEINRTMNKIAINGTIVPASTLNSFFSGIPLIGQVLSGGSGSIFAATYRMTGALDDPQTNVNPLSVLAPGIIRRILFEGGE